MVKKNFKKAHFDLTDVAHESKSKPGSRTHRSYPHDVISHKSNKTTSIKAIAAAGGEKIENSGIYLFDKGTNQNIQIFFCIMILQYTYKFFTDTAQC